MDGLQLVRAISGQQEEREAPQQISDVIDQNILIAHENGRAQNRVAHPRFDHCLFIRGFAPEVREMRLGRRIGDTDVNHPFHARSFCRADEFARVLHGAWLGIFTLVKTHPVRIHKDIHALQTARHAERSLP